MIIKAAERGNGGQAGAYLIALKDNARAELIEIKGTLSQNVKDAVREMEAIASASRCLEKNYFYHASINPAKGETLTPEQWEYAINTLEKAQGLEGHQRIVSEHEKQDGSIHRHILWCRVHPETLTAARLSWDFAKNEEVSRHLENEFGLEKVKGVHVFENEGDRGKRGPTHNEVKQSQKTGVNLYKWRQEVRALASIGENGAEIIAALEAQGHMVAQGEKVDFLLLDPTGTPHRMAQSLGLKVKDLKEKFSDIDPAALPDIAAAQVRQKERLAEIERNKAAERGAGMYNKGGMVSQQTDALRHIKDKKKSEKRKEKREKAAAERGIEKRQKAAPEKTAGNRKEKSQPQSHQPEPERPKERYSQRESLIRDIAPEAAAKMARSEIKDAKREVTDAKREKSAADIMQEVFQTNFGGKPKSGGRGLDDWDRERER